MSSKDCSPSRRLGAQVRPITIANYDFIPQGCPLHNGVKSPTASGRSRSGPESHGYGITGSHEVLLLRWPPYWNYNDAFR
jgi:hypothetical protein